MRRLLVLPFALTLVLAGSSSLASTAAARCAVVMLPEEVQRSPFVVEAVLERAGATASFRTVTVWKGGTAAPARRGSPLYNVEVTGHRVQVGSRQERP